MAKQIIPEELEALLQEYLTDGIITPKERQVLLRKAEKLGIDTDEFDLYIDAQEQKVQQTADAAARKLKGQTCPFCGESVPQLADKCPSCGRTITAEASEELKEIIDNLEEALIDIKSGKDIAKNKAHIERYIRKADLYYSSNPKIQKLLTEVKEETELAEKKAKSEAKKKTFVKVVTYNKWLTGLVIILLGVGIWGIYNAFKAPDPTENSSECVSVIQKSLKSNDISNAENVYREYIEKHKEKDIRAGSLALIEYYSNNSQWTKAMAIVESFGDIYENKDPDIKLSILKITDAAIEQGDTRQASLMNNYIYNISDLDTSAAYRHKIAELMAEKGEIHEAEDLLDLHSWTSAYDIDQISIILTGMKKAGKTKQELKKYIDTKLAAMDEFWIDSKAPLKERAYNVAGIDQ